MQTVEHVEITSTRANPHIDPGLTIWGWEVPVYLFLGGLVAGLLVLSSLSVLARREERTPALARVAPMLGLPLLGLGLLALFLDLEYKAHVFRFYTAARPTSPMSWGSWILLAVSVTSGLAGLSALARTRWFSRLPLAGWGLVRALVAFADRNARRLAWCNAALGVALGIYTGILLSAFAARPLWNSAVLGPLFLVSGLSTGAALVALLARDEREHDTLVRLDVGLILAEGALLGLWLIGLVSGGRAAREAAGLILGGPYTAAFWTLVVLVGLALPAFLEWMTLRRGWKGRMVAPALVLLGGLALRFVLVDAGQLAGMGG